MASELNCEFACDFTSVAGYAAHSRIMFRAFNKYQDILDKHGIRLRLIDRPKDRNKPILSDSDQEIFDKFSSNEIGAVNTRVFFEPAHFASFQKDVKTVIFCQWEVTGVRNYSYGGKDQMNWVRQFNYADMILTSSTSAKEAYLNSKVFKPILVVPGPIANCSDFSELPIANVTVNDDGQPIDKAKRPIVVGYVAEWSPRKNLETFIRDFSIAFDNGEAIAILKTYSHGSSNDAILAAIKKVKDSCRKNSLPEIVVINEMLTEEEMGRLFNSIDIYYAPSRGEGFSVPVSLAVSAGCYPIIPDWGGPADFIKGSDFCIPGVFSPALGMETYDSNQFWYSICEKTAIEKLRLVYNQIRNSPNVIQNKLASLRKEMFEIASEKKFVESFSDAMIQLHAG